MKQAMSVSFAIRNKSLVHLIHFIKDGIKNMSAIVGSNSIFIIISCIVY